MHSSPKILKASETPILVTTVTASIPPVLTKGIYMGEDGQLKKKTGGVLVKGTCQKCMVRGLEGLIRLKKTLQKNQAIIYSISDYAEADIVTRKRLNGITVEDGNIIARTRDYFHYPPAYGILQLDIDLPEELYGMSIEEVVARLCRILPWLSDAPYAYFHSSSSCIYCGDRLIRGTSGVRILVLVKNPSDIPRVGKISFKRCWLAGDGYIKISKNGSLLPRSWIDEAVFQPERMDFLAGAVCEPPLVQRIPEAECRNSDKFPLDTEKIVCDLTPAEKEKFQKIIKKAKDASREEADKVKAEWSKNKTEAEWNDLPPDEQTEANRCRIERKYSLASENILVSDFTLRTPDGEEFTVAEVQADPDGFKGTPLSYPLDPSYREGACVAYINLYPDKTPYIFCFVHGGGKFRLVKNQKVIRIAPGKMADEQAAVVDYLKTKDVFEHSERLVHVFHDGTLMPMTPEMVCNMLDEGVVFLKQGKGNKEIPVNTPKIYGERVFDARIIRAFPSLKAVLNQPILNLKSLNLINHQGYDSETGYYLTCVPEDWHDMPERLSSEQVAACLKVLLKPFIEFPFESDLDFSNFLCALFTSVIRPELGTSPGLAVDAPIAGSGKTILCKCLAILGGMLNPATLPSMPEKESEVENKLLSVGLAGEPVVIFDNVEQTLESPIFSSYLTAESGYKGRILHSNKIPAVSTKTLVLFNGNNLRIAGDLNRRVLRIRISPKDENPRKRSFCLRPVNYCVKNRIQMVRAALLLLENAMRYEKKPSNPTGSFEDWSEGPRRAVLWLSKQDVMANIFKQHEFKLVDPDEGFDRNYENDTKFRTLEAVLEAWDSLSINKGILVKDLLKSSMCNLLRDAVEESGMVFNANNVGIWLGRQQGIWRKGKKIEIVGKQARTNIWKLIKQDVGELGE